MLGVVNEIPVPWLVPPVEEVYHFNVPALVVASKVMVPTPQRLPGVVLTTAGIVLTVAITAVLSEIHCPFVAST